jgi:UrcA family protein
MRVHIALATVGCLAVSLPSMGQQPGEGELVVEAPHVQKTTIKGHSALSIISKVNYKDLDLATNSGAVELQKRIKDTATQICGQLKKLYPDSVDTDPPCVEAAVSKATTQAKKLIAAAESSAKQSASKP